MKNPRRRTGSRSLVSRDRLNELVQVDVESGKIRWKPREVTHWTIHGWNKHYAGKEAGFYNSDGYLIIHIDKKAHLVHRVIWFYAHGYWPIEIDHINGARDDNRISNLREVSRKENRRNAGRNRNNRSGVTGVCWDTNRGRWLAYITVDRKQKHLGHFLTIEDAARARKLAQKKYGFHANHGREAPLQ